MKSLKNIFLISSSNRCRRKSGKKAGNQAAGVVGGPPCFRKLDDREMKRRKTGEYVRVGSRLPHGVHSEAVRCCGKRLPRVQSAVKCRPDARCEEPGFAHGIHPGAFPRISRSVALTNSMRLSDRAAYRKSGSGQCPHSELVSFRIAFGCFHPNFLMAVVGESELGDAAVRTLVKCDARTASTGIKKPVGKLG
jgi:hypothetical protein